jgi:2-polyprenyl-3-methyl-5-hydroxy-6-metoxy-1,4-benzoquinol methylase
MLNKKKSGPASLVNSLNVQIPRYLENLNCGVCLSSNSLRKHSIYPSLDVNETVLYICTSCTSIYNSTTESTKITNVVAQVEWLEKQNFYIVPTERQNFELLVDEAANIFRWFSENFDYDFSKKTFFEIGAGSGISSVAASRYFSKCVTTDLTLERLQMAKKMSNSENLTVISITEVDGVKFDFFFAWHVFEHLINPGQVFEDAFTKLNQGGVMFMQVPLVTERHIFPEHIFMHNEFSWSKILSKFEVRAKYFFYDTALCAMTIVVFKK